MGARERHGPPVATKIYFQLPHTPATLLLGASFHIWALQVFDWLKNSNPQCKAAVAIADRCSWCPAPDRHCCCCSCCFFIIVHSACELRPPQPYQWWCSSCCLVYLLCSKLVAAWEAASNPNPVRLLQNAWVSASQKSAPSGCQNLHQIRNLPFHTTPYHA